VYGSVLGHKFFFHQCFLESSKLANLHLYVSHASFASVGWTEGSCRSTLISTKKDSSRDCCPPSRATKKGKTFDEVESSIGTALLPSTKNSRIGSSPFPSHPSACDPKRLDEAFILLPELSFAPAAFSYQSLAQPFYLNLRIHTSKHSSLSCWMLLFGPGSMLVI
jgi:hypothetical protein